MSDATSVLASGGLREEREAELERLSDECELWSSRIAKLGALQERVLELARDAREQWQRCHDELRQELEEIEAAFPAPGAAKH